MANEGTQKKNMFMTGGHLLMKLLIALIVLSFAVWGVGDVFRGGGNSNSTVAEVGSERITVGELTQVVEQEANKFRQMYGDNPEFNRILTPQVLDQMVGDSLLRQEAHRQGLRISDELVVQELSQNPRFRDEKGVFNKAAFLGFLRSIGETEHSIKEKMKDGMAVRALLESLMVNSEVPLPMLKQLYVYEKEARVAELMRIPGNYKIAAPEPSPAELEQFYESRKQAFALPEFRDISFAVVNPDKAEKEVTVSEEEIKQAYEEQLADFSTPERRHLKQMVFDDEAAAKEAYEAVKAGGDFDRLAKEKAKQQADQTDLGRLARSDMLEGHEDAVFALKKGEVGAPLKSDLGWHVFKVVDITPPQVKPLSEVRKGIADHIKEEKSADYLYNLGIRIQDSLAGGNTMEEVADVMGLTVQKVRGVNREGLGIDGKKVALPSVPGFLEAAFASAQGDAQMMEAPDGTGYVVRVDQVVPERFRALEEVRGEVLEAWNKDKRQALLKELAERASQKTRQGSSTLAAEAKALDLKLETTPALLRSSSGFSSKVPAELVKELFSLRKEGDITAVYALDDGGYVVAALAQVEPAPAEVSDEELDAIAKRMKSQLLDETYAQLGNYLHEQYDVEIKREVLDAMTAPRQE